MSTIVLIALLLTFFGTASATYTNLINYNRKCLAASGNSNNADANLIQWDCTSEFGQHWSYNNTDLGVENNIHLCNMWGLCAASPRNDPGNTHLIQYYFTNEAGQRFTFEESPITGWFWIKNGYGKCLADSNNSVQNGAKIFAWDCLPLEAGQLWQFV